MTSRRVGESTINEWIASHVLYQFWPEMYICDTERFFQNLHVFKAWDLVENKVGTCGMSTSVIILYFSTKGVRETTLNLQKVYSAWTSRLQILGCFGGSTMVDEILDYVVYAKICLYGALLLWSLCINRGKGYLWEESKSMLRNGSAQQYWVSMTKEEIGLGRDNSPQVSVASIWRGLTSQYNTTHLARFS